MLMPHVMFLSELLFSVWLILLLQASVSARLTGFKMPLDLVMDVVEVEFSLVFSNHED